MYDTPEDHLVWDVGHQSYPHKILTGRKIKCTLCANTAVWPVSERSESEYDAFGVGHSSTSIGAALGMAVADKQFGATTAAASAIIGDGAMTAGQAFERPELRRRYGCRFAGYP